MIECFKLHDECLEVIDIWWKSVTRHVSLRFYPKRILKVWFGTNGATKGTDRCFDLNVWFAGFWFSYTDFAYDRRKKDKK